MATSIKLMDVAQKFRNGIKASTDIKNFCLNNYNKDCLYVMGRDQRHPLGADDAPYILVTPMGKVGGEMTATFSFVIDVEFGIVDREFSDYDMIGAKEMRGFYKLDELGNYIKEALFNLSYSNIMADDIEYDLNSRSMYPYFVGYMTIGANVPDVIGGTIGLN